MYKRLRTVSRLNSKLPCRRSSVLPLSNAAKLYSTKADTSFSLTTLPNGLRVAIDPSPAYFASMGVYIDAGSRYESGKMTGLSHIVDRLAFKSTKTKTAQQVEEELGLLGGNYMAASSRETMMYQASAFYDDSEAMIRALADEIANSQVTEQDLMEQKFNAEYEIGEIWQKPELILPELLHTTAYSGTLGNPLLCPKDLLDRIDTRLIQEYRQKFYVPERMVLGLVGVPTETAMEWANKYFGGIPPAAPSAPKIIKEPALYTGGEICIDSYPSPIPNMPEFWHLYVAFEGLPISDPDIYALATLQTLLGGGGSFSAGGPGKGMYSRLYTQVLNQYGFIESALGFNHSYSDSGLFGISMSCVPEAAPYMVEIIGMQLSQLFSSMGGGALTYTEVSRAKNQLRSSLLMNLESKMVELEDMGRQVLIQGFKTTVSEMCEQIEKLSVEDLQRVAQRVLTGKASQTGSGKATYVMQGERDKFGDLDAVLSKYGLGLK